MTAARTSASAAASTELGRVGVLADPYLYEWQVEALETMVRETAVEISRVVVNSPPPARGYDRDDAGRRSLDNPGGIGWHDLQLFADVLSTEGPWALVLAERKLAWLLGLTTPGLERRVPVDDVACLADVPRTRCEPVPAGGAWNQLPDEVVDTVASETDVVVRFGFGLLTGRVLDEPEYGTLSFHPADVRRYRGLGPSRIFLDGQETAGATLQRLNDEVDGGEIILIETADVADALTLDEVEARINELQTGMLARGIERLQNPTFEPTPPAQLGEYTPLSKRMELPFALRLLARNLAGRARSFVYG